MDADEIQRRWAARVHQYTNEGPPVCRGCGDVFSTGSVVLVFGGMEVVERKHFLCEQCGADRMRHGPTTEEKASGDKLPRFPTASIVFLEEEHRVRIFHALPEAVRKRLLDADTIVERVNDGLRKFVERFGGAVVEDEEDAQGARLKLEDIQHALAALKAHDARAMPPPEVVQGWIVIERSYPKVAAVFAQSHPEWVAELRLLAAEYPDA